MIDYWAMAEPTELREDQAMIVSLAGMVQTISKEGEKTISLEEVTETTSYLAKSFWRRIRPRLTKC